MTLKGELQRIIREKTAELDAKVTADEAFYAELRDGLTAACERLRELIANERVVHVQLREGPGMSTGLWVDNQLPPPDAAWIWCTVSPRIVPSTDGASRVPGYSVSTSGTGCVSGLSGNAEAEDAACACEIVATKAAEAIAVLEHAARRAGRI